MIPGDAPVSSVPVSDALRNGLAADTLMGAIMLCLGCVVIVPALLAQVWV